MKKESINFREENDACQAEINTLRNNYSQANSDIKSIRGQFSQAQGDINKLNVGLEATCKIIK